VTGAINSAANIAASGMKNIRRNIPIKSLLPLNLTGIFHLNKKYLCDLCELCGYILSQLEI
jgi:hypothetical protein